MDYDDFSVVILVVVFLFLLTGFLLGNAYGNYHAVEKYCESTAVTPVTYEGDYFCIDSDNQLHKIEWLED